MTKLKNELSCSFASLSAHNGVREAKDDLESLGFLIIFMLTGKLPWKGIFQKKTFSKWQKVYFLKSQNLADLCAGCPIEIQRYLAYVRSLSNSQNPDYSYVKNMLKALMPGDKINNIGLVGRKRRTTLKKPILIEDLNSISSEKLKTKKLNRMTTDMPKNKEKMPPARSKSRKNIKLDESPSKEQKKFRVRSKTLKFAPKAEISSRDEKLVSDKTLSNLTLPEFKNKQFIINSRNEFLYESKLKDENKKKIDSCLII